MLKTLNKAGLRYVLLYSVLYLKIVLVNGYFGVPAIFRAFKGFSDSYKIYKKEICRTKGKTKAKRRAFLKLGIVRYQIKTNCKASQQESAKMND